MCLFVLVCVYKYPRFPVSIVIFLFGMFSLCCTIVLEAGQRMGIYSVLSLYTAFSNKPVFGAPCYDLCALQWLFAESERKPLNGSKLKTISFWMEAGNF